MRMLGQLLYCAQCCLRKCLPVSPIRFIFKLTENGNEATERIQFTQLHWRIVWFCGSSNGCTFVQELTPVHTKTYQQVIFRRQFSFQFFTKPADNCIGKHPRFSLLTHASAPPKTDVLLGENGIFPPPIDDLVLPKTALPLSANARTRFHSMLLFWPFVGKPMALLLGVLHVMLAGDEKLNLFINVNTRRITVLIRAL